VSRTDASLISDGEEKGIKWFCQTCLPSLIISNKTNAKSTEERLDAIHHSIKELSNKIEHHKADSMPEKLFSDVLKSNTSTIIKSVDENSCMFI